jgi:hypothetical protein
MKLRMTSITTNPRLFRPRLGAALGLGAAALVAACSSSPESTTGTTGSSSSSGAGSGGSGGSAPACSKAPPTGFSAVVAPSTDGTLGLDTAMVADENDDPMIAYQWYKPGGAGAETAVYFTRWDRCAGAFTAPVKVDTVGVVSTNNPTRRIDLAYEAATKKLAIVYEAVIAEPGFESNPSNEIYLQTSTDQGATWAGKLHVSDQKGGDIQQARGPVVAVSGGMIHLAYQQDNRDCCRLDEPDCGGCSSVWYLDGDGATFSRAQVSDAGGPVQVAGSALSLTVDSAGKPALAFFGAPAKGYTDTVLYWRPGSAPVPVMDSNEVQNDDPSLSLAFDGTKPRLAAHLVADESADYDLRFSASDDGVTWGAPVKLPRDKSDYTAWYQSLAIDGKGDAAVSAYINGGSGDSLCGGPRIVRSSDLQAWTACGADQDKKYPDIGGKYVDSYFTHENKLILGFTGTLAGDQSGSGVVLWREP